MKKQILAIDDSKAIRYLLQTVLGKHYKVTTASDAASAMFWLTKKNLPDLIIAEPHLPDVKDWELIEYLSSSGLYGEIPIVALSAFDKKETLQKSKELGVRHCFSKPFNPIDLIKVVDNVLTNKQRFQESLLKLV